MDEEIAILVSNGSKFGFNFKVMRTKVVHCVTVFKIIVKRQIRKGAINFKHKNDTKF